MGNFRARVFLSAVILTAMEEANAVYGNTRTDYSPEFENAVLTITGAADISEIAEDDLLHFKDLASDPLEINRCSRSTLLASGILSQYQVETVLEWRERHGDILSQEELAAVDGFNGSSAAGISAFLTFGGGQRIKDTLTMKYKVSSGAGFKADKGQGFSRLYGKAEINAASPSGDFSASVAARPEWSRPISSPEELGWNISYGAPYGRTRWLTSATLGCFNTRFGQGLLNWSGVNIESFASPSSLMKRPGGISPYRSWSPSYGRCGLGARMDFGRLSVSPFVDFGGTLYSLEGRPGSEPQAEYGGNVAWNYRHGQIGANLLFSGGGQGYSVDFQHSIRGTVIYGEACLNVKGGACEPSALIGVTAQTGPVETGFRATLSHYVHNVTAALSHTSDGRERNFDAGASASYFPTAKGHTPEGAAQLKARLSYRAGTGTGWSFETRADASLRSLTRFSNPTAPYASTWSRNRYELRQDVKWNGEKWLASLRLDAVYGTGPAGLAYMEGGYAGRIVTADVQAGVFRIDEWDDRIYVYMRDAPGGYSVPAMYGRGWWMSVYAKSAIGRHVSLYLRIEYTSYPWARPEDSRNRDSLTAKFQINLSI